MAMGILTFFDKLEDKVRGFLSRRPIIYAFIAGAGIILFWRGVWYTADFVSQATFSYWSGATIGIESSVVWWDGLISIAVGSVLLLISGAFVTSFIGNELILSGVKGEKKLAERAQAELRGEDADIRELKHEVSELAEDLQELEKRIGGR